ncbi:MAG: lamin tail domain-containing protein [Duncaniella sp.]|nr:lamin tail domain-containing protein [Duncaniella sp.]
MKKRLLTLLLVTLACVSAISAQGRRGLRINEVMIVNDSTSVVDDFGRYPAWIELYNSTFAPLEISSVFLTNDRNNNTLYPVPLGDVNTEIPSRQHILFWSDGEPNKGTFHTNFTFTPGEDNYIAIYDAQRSDPHRRNRDSRFAPPRPVLRPQGGRRGWRQQCRRLGSARRFG